MIFEATVQSVMARAKGTYTDRGAIVYDVELSARIPPLARTARMTMSLTGLSVDEAMGFVAGKTVRVMTTPTD